MNLASKYTLYNFTLLFSILLFICGSFLIRHPLILTISNNVFFSVVLFATTLTIKKKNARLLHTVLVIIVITLISEFLIHNKFFDSFATVTSVIFFLFIVFRLIQQAASSKLVDRVVILESINGYLLMGLSGGIIFALLSRVQDNAYAFTHSSTQQLSDFFYFGFITQTTIGYGDITPLTNLARLLTIIPVSTG